MNKCKSCIYNRACSPYDIEYYPPNEKIKCKLMFMLTKIRNINTIKVEIGKHDIYLSLNSTGWADILVALDVYDYELVNIFENTLIVRKAE